MRIKKPKIFPVSNKEINSIVDNVCKRLQFKKPKTIRIKLTKTDLDGFDGLFQWNLIAPIIYIRKPVIKNLIWLKHLLAHEIVHYIDFLKNGKWSIAYVDCKASDVAYYSNKHEFLAKDIAEELYPQNKKFWLKIKKQILKQGFKEE